MSTSLMEFFLDFMRVLKSPQLLGMFSGHYSLKSVNKKRKVYLILHCLFNCSTSEAPQAVCHVLDPAITTENTLLSIPLALIPNEAVYSTLRTVETGLEQIKRKEEEVDGKSQTQSRDVENKAMFV